MRRIQFAPNAVGAGGNITIPTSAPDIDTVVAAEITRLPTALGVADHAAADVVLCFGNHTQAQVIACFQNHTQAQVANAFAAHPAANVIAGVGNHTQAQVVACLADHPDHTHDLGVIVGVVAVGEHYGAAAPAGTGLQSTTGSTILGGNPLTGGVLNNAAEQNHVGSGVDLVHVAGANVDHAQGIAVPHVGVADLEHVVGVALVHGAPANPVVVVAAVTKFTTRIVRFTVVNVLAGDLVTLVYLEVGERVLVS